MDGLSNLYIGVMSGTSLDAIDVVLAKITPNETKLLNTSTYPIPLALRQEVINLSLNHTTSVKDLGILDNKFAHLFADAIKQLLTNTFTQPEEIRAIGCHGQTVYHYPSSENPFSMQIGDANLIATKCKIDCISDFRRKDIALGGQGAPLVPAFHKFMFPVTDSAIIGLNIGGIANISVMRPRCEVIGYDTGPGNILMDAWIKHCLDKTYDKDALFAKSGTIIPELLKLMLVKEPFFSLKAPKSTGRERFNIEWIFNILENCPKKYAPCDIQATLCELTAISIANEVKKYTIGNNSQLICCGGGAYNPLLQARLKEHLPKWEIYSSLQYGVEPDFVEAFAFAWLAYCRVHNLPSNEPAVTGALYKTSLGVIYQK